jgi:hypothetical protein
VNILSIHRSIMQILNNTSNIEITLFHHRNILLLSSYNIEITYLFNIEIFYLFHHTRLK